MTHNHTIYAKYASECMCREANYSNEDALRNVTRCYLKWSCEIYKGNGIEILNRSEFVT